MANHQIARLYTISNKAERTIIGLMSGTSLDGLDVALCKFSGSGPGSTFELLQFATIPYDPEVKTEIRRVFAQQEIDFQHLALLNPWIGTLHARMVVQQLAAWGVDKATVDAIASHGQTVFHAPRILHGLDKWPNGTLQIGDGDHVAVESGMLTISDFRQKHVAGGGEGAPLAAYGDYLLLSKAGENRLLLNMGGISNFTWLPGNLDPGEVLVTDTGPGNTLMDAMCRKWYQEDYDRDAQHASKGTTNESLLNALLSDPFFTQDLPRTTGPELFNPGYLYLAQQNSNTLSLSKEDVLATLAEFTAKSIVEAIRKTIAHNDFKVYTSGGGSHNPLVMSHLKKHLPEIEFAPTDRIGMPGDAKEAILFACLANETLSGEPVRFTRKGMPQVLMGKISFPV